MLNSYDLTIGNVNNNKEEISEKATKLLKSKQRVDRLIQKTKDLMSWIETLYPKDYEIYLKGKFDVVDENNVSDVLRNVIVMCTANNG